MLLFQLLVATARKSPRPAWTTAASFLATPPPAPPRLHLAPSAPLALSPSHLPPASRYMPSPRALEQPARTLRLACYQGGQSRLQFFRNLFMQRREENRQHRRPGQRHKKWLDNSPDKIAEQEKCPVGKHRCQTVTRRRFRRGSIFHGRYIIASKRVHRSTTKILRHVIQFHPADFLSV